MNCPKFDFHIHTAYLGCANETMQVDAIAEQCIALGVTAIGITDHLNSLEKLPPHLNIRHDIESLQPGIEVYFGVELNFLECDGGFAFSEAIKKETGFQFVIGGIHSTYLEQYDVKKAVDIQHRHHLKACRDPLVDVLVHPYWFPRREIEKEGLSINETIKAVPESYARELGQVARETGTAIEINAMANLNTFRYDEEYIQRYIDYLRIVAEEGPQFSTASDAHDIKHLASVAGTWKVVEELELAENQIWHPPGEPLIKAS